MPPPLHRSGPSPRPASCAPLALLVALVLGSGLVSAPVLAQEREELGLPEWTVGLELGVQFPAALYDDWITGRLARQDFHVSTRYRETVDLAPIGRAVIRYRPLHGFGVYAAGQYGRAGTTASFGGGIEPPESIGRHLSFWSLELGASIRLVDWKEGEGALDYTLGPGIVGQHLDLSAGHRDAFARVAEFRLQSDFDWADREWTSKAFALGASARFPLNERLALRVAAHDYVISVATDQLSRQEGEEVRRLTDQEPVFVYDNYTAHYPALRAGVELVLSRFPPRVPPTARSRLPERQAAPRVATRAVMEARGRLAKADTAGAVRTLRQGVQLDPEDALAWRDLSLLLAALSDEHSAVREEAWAAVQRALRLNPGDASLLVAASRVQSLLSREGRIPERGEPLELTGVSVHPEEADVLAVGWGLVNLTSEQGRSRYRVELEVFGPDQRAVPARVAGAGTQPEDVVSFLKELEEDAGAADGVRVRLEESRPGRHLLRLRVTDLMSGRTTEATAAFDLP